MIPRPYQKKLYDEICEASLEHNKVLAQADTGFGKSILIGMIANNRKGRNLILTHRIELLHQNSEWINDLGVLHSKVKKVYPIQNSRNVIAMAQTIVARFKKYGSDYLGSFDTVICDEVHVDFFKSVYDQLPGVKIIAFTATPIINKKEKKIVDEEEFVRKITLRNEFDFLCQGVSTKELIELGFLTQDFNIQLTPPNLDDLVSSKTTPDGYTSVSLSEVFGSHSSLENVYDGYQRYCVGKKTLIFNPTTKVNKEMYDFFIKRGVPVKIYDSVNKIEGQTRGDVTDWFKNTRDAVLLNVGVFTTGFSVDDLEAIIYNKKTKSLSLFLQSAGRGSRVLKDWMIKEGLVKNNFLFLDMGLNIQEHGKWSDFRDWSQYFKINKWERKKEIDTMQMWECKPCGYFNIVGTLYSEDLECIVCNGCGKPKPPPKKKKLISGKFVALNEPVYPNATKMVEYAKRIGADGNFVNRLAIKTILDLFIYHTEKIDYVTRKEKYTKRIGELYRPVYFILLHNKELKSSRKALATQLDKIKDKVENYYKL
jgi:superfamily II DNA or RNA helicase